MAFIKPFQAPNGVQLEYHQVARAEVTPDGITIHVKSWPDEACQLAGRPALFTSYVTLPAGDVLAALQVGVLAQPTGAFVGAIPVDDSLPALDLAKAKRWQAIKDERDRREAGTFDWDGRTFKVDLTRLTGAALDAVIALQDDEPYAEPWVLDDNTVTVLTAEEQIALGRACKAYVSSIWAVSQMLRAEIQAAETSEEVAAVVWPAPSGTG